MTRSSYPNRRPKMTRTRAPWAFTTMRATTSYIIISIFNFTLQTSPYDPLLDGTIIEKEHASSARADYDSSSSKHELNALAVLRQHYHHKETWTKGKRLLSKRLPRPNLPPPRLLQCSRLHCRLYRQPLQPRHHQLLPWDEGAHMPS